MIVQGNQGEVEKKNAGSCAARAFSSLLGYARAQSSKSSSGQARNCVATMFFVLDIPLNFQRQCLVLLYFPQNKSLTKIVLIVSF